MMTTKLIISANGPDRKGIVSEISSIISECHANIETSKMIRLDKEFAMLILIEIQTKALNDTAAILIADWCFKDSDGKPTTDGEIAQYFYMLSKQTGVWKVVGEVTVSAKKRIQIT